MQEYKCISCGAPIGFDPAVGKFKCEYCSSEFTEKEYSEFLESNNKEDENKEGTGELNEYICKNCGAEVVSDDTTTSTFCFYCHSPVVLTNSLKGEFKPDKIVPFKIDKKKAREIFKDFTKGKKYLPNKFNSQSQIEKITGMYLPFWLGDFVANIDYSAVGMDYTSWKSGDTRYTKTKEYDVKREGKINIDNFGEVAYDKVDRNLINGITPFNEELAVDFSNGYLAGFFAEKYNIDREELKPHIINNLQDHVKAEIRSSIKHTTVKDVVDNTTYDVNAWKYVFLPAYIMTYFHNGKTYAVAINGQTGKPFGELPLDNKKLYLRTGIRTLIFIILLILGGWFIW